MPLKKLEWGDIPKEMYVKEKDQLEKWIECNICHVKIRIRSQYCYTEWITHCEGVKHCKIANSDTLKKVQKIETFFLKKKKKRPLSEENSSSKPVTESQTPDGKRKKTSTCPGFYYGKNTDLLPLYEKYKREDVVNNSINIQCSNGIWSVHSINCTGEQVNSRSSLCPDKKACENCFNYKHRNNLRERIGRMSKTLCIENYLMERTSTYTGFSEISKFLKANVKTASPNALKLRERCKQYVTHYHWLKTHFPKLQQYYAVDSSGKILHEKWITKLSKMYHDEPGMKDSLLHALIQFTLSRYDGHVNAQCSPKLIAFFQNVYALNPKFYKVFSQNFGGYHERTIRRYEANESPDAPVIDCSEKMIKKRSGDWITRLRQNNKDDVILVSLMADATKVPPIGEFCQRHKVWVGGTFPNHCIKEKDYKQHEFVKSTMATEIKVGMLSVQNIIEAISPFKIIAARPQATNEVADDYKDLLLHAVDELKNVYCISIAFDGLAAETQFIRKNLISFMNGTSGTVAMTDCNHAAKNIRSQLVLGSEVITGGNAIFDVGLLRLAGIAEDLYRVSDYASDVLVLKLCSSDTINKLMSLLVTDKEDPLNIAFMAISLYLLRAFLCAYNAESINSEARVSMIWSALMWFTSLEGISKISKNNLITSCLGGIFLAAQKKVRNLRFTTTEPLEHTFGTTRSWRREFSVNEFVTYSNKLDIILKNVIENGICSSTSTKGYMHGFQGFAEVVSRIKQKLTKKSPFETEDNWAVDVDYNGTIVDQIEKKIISAIGRINGPILNIMAMFNMQHLSPYCSEILSIKDLCSIYQSSSRQDNNLSIGDIVKAKTLTRNTDEIIKRLSNLALEFNSGNGNKLSTPDESIDADNVISKTLKGGEETWIEFDCQCFYNFISEDVSNCNVGKMLCHMQDSMRSSMEKRE